MLWRGPVVRSGNAHDARKIAFAGDDAVGGRAQVRIGRQDRAIGIPREDRVKDRLMLRLDIARLRAVGKGEVAITRVAVHQHRIEVDQPARAASRDQRQMEGAVSLLPFGIE